MPQVTIASFQHQYSKKLKSNDKNLIDDLDFICTCKDLCSFNSIMYKTQDQKMNSKYFIN
jgi:hypothetical protein